MQHCSGVTLEFLYEGAALHGCGACNACDPMITVGREETGRTSTDRSAQQEHAAESNVPARNEREWSGNRHSCPREARPVGWQRKGWPNWSIIAKSYAGATDQQLSEAMSQAEISTAVLDNASMSQEARARSVQLYFILIMLCTGRPLDRVANAPHGWSMDAWRLLFQAYSAKNNARLVVMMLEVLSFPLETNDVVNSLETMERKIKEFERHASIDIPEFLKVGIVIRQTDKGPTRTHLIMNAHRLTTLQGIKAEVTMGKQAQSAVMANTGDAMDVDVLSKGSPKGASNGEGPPNVRVPQETTGCRQRKVEGCEGGRQQRWWHEGVRRQVFQMLQGGPRVERLQVQGDACVRDGRGGLGRDWMLRHGKCRVKCIRHRSVQVPEGNRKHGIGIDSCAVVTVFPKTVAEYYPRARNTRRSKELQASVGQASARSWWTEGAGQTQR